MVYPNQVEMSSTNRFWATRAIISAESIVALLRADH